MFGEIESTTETDLMYGLADIDGVHMTNMDGGEIFGFATVKTPAEVNADQFAMCIRAAANQDKKAVVFRAELNYEDSDALTELVKLKKSKEALKLIAEKSVHLQLSTYGTTKAAATNNWKLISGGA